PESPAPQDRASSLPTVLEHRARRGPYFTECRGGFCPRGKVSQRPLEIQNFHRWRGWVAHTWELAHSFQSNMSVGLPYPCRSALPRPLHLWEGHGFSRAAMCV